MLWDILKIAGELYLAASILGVPLLLALCKTSGRISRMEEHETFEQWLIRKEELEREAYRH